MNRISNAFLKSLPKKKSAFITYLVCGDPNIEGTKKILNIMADSGVDLIELGIPFTDPIADGPIIQKGIERALQKGNEKGAFGDIEVRFKDLIAINKENAAEILTQAELTRKQDMELHSGSHTYASAITDILIQ